MSTDNNYLTVFNSFDLDLSINHESTDNFDNPDYTSNNSIFSSHSYIRPIDSLFPCEQKNLSLLKDEEESLLISDDKNALYYNLNNQEIKEEKKANEEIEEKEIKEIEINESLPPHYPYNKIKNEILPKLDIDSSIQESFVDNDNIKKIEYETSDDNFSIEKRSRAKRNKNKPLKEPKMLGRKKKDDETNRDHNKKAKDNILQKIKSHFLDYLLNFINFILRKYIDKENIISYIKLTKKKDLKDNEKNDLIKDLNYKKIVNETSKDKNIQFLGMSLKDFLSQDISPKLSTYIPSSNKKIINKIIEDYSNEEVINFVFNLKLSEWLDVFLKKKEFSDFKNISKDNLDKIMFFDRIDKLLEKIYTKNKNDIDYFSCFIICIYNYERIWRIKKSRNINRNKEDKK